MEWGTPPKIYVLKRAEAKAVEEVGKPSGPQTDRWVPIIGDPTGPNPDPHLILTSPSPHPHLTLTSSSPHLVPFARFPLTFGLTFAFKMGRLYIIMHHHM